MKNGWLLRWAWAFLVEHFYGVVDFLAGVFIDSIMGMNTKF